MYVSKQPVCWLYHNSISLHHNRFLSAHKFHISSNCKQDYLQGYEGFKVLNLKLSEMQAVIGGGKWEKFQLFSLISSFMFKTWQNALKKQCESTYLSWNLAGRLAYWQWKIFGTELFSHINLQKHTKLGTNEFLQYRVTALEHCSLVESLSPETQGQNLKQSSTI